MVNNAYGQDVDEVRDLVAPTLDSADNMSLDAFLVKGVPGQRQVAPLTQAKSFFDGVPEEQVNLHYALR